MLTFNFHSVFSIFSLVMSVLLFRLYVIFVSTTDFSFLRPIQTQKGYSQLTMKLMDVSEILLVTATRPDHEVELQYRLRICGYLAD